MPSDGLSERQALHAVEFRKLNEQEPEALVGEGVNLLINACTATTLEQTAAELCGRFPAIKVVTVAGDVAEPATRRALLSACPQVDILVNNAGGPPPGDFSDWGRDDWLKALDANMLTPIGVRLR